MRLSKLSEIDNNVYDMGVYGFFYRPPYHYNKEVLIKKMAITTGKYNTREELEKAVIRYYNSSAYLIREIADKCGVSETTVSRIAFAYRKETTRKNLAARNTMNTGRFDTREELENFVWSRYNRRESLQSISRSAKISKSLVSKICENMRSKDHEIIMHKKIKNSKCEDIHEMIDDFIMDYRISDYNYAEVKEIDESQLNTILSTLIELKFGRDCDGHFPVEICVINKHKKEPLPFFAISTTNNRLAIKQLSAIMTWVADKIKNTVCDR